MLKNILLACISREKEKGIYLFSKLLLHFDTLNSVVLSGHKEVIDLEEQFSLSIIAKTTEFQGARVSFLFGIL